MGAASGRPPVYVQLERPVRKVEVLVDLSDCQVTVLLPVKDIDRARGFYENQLALPAGVEKPDGKVVYRCGGTEIALFPRTAGPRPSTRPSASGSRTSTQRSLHCKRAASSSPTTTCQVSRPLSTSAFWGRRRLRGSPIPKATSSVCMKTCPKARLA